MALGIIRMEAYTEEGRLIPVSVLIDEGSDYRAAIKKYVDEGYASRVEEKDLYSNNQYYLPHHGVYKKVYV